MKKILTYLSIFILLLIIFLFLFNVFFVTENKVNVYYNGKQSAGYEHIYSNNKIYISAEYLMQNNLLDYYWDKEFNKISIFNSFNYETIHYNDTKVIYKKESYNIQDILIIDNEKLYFCSNFLKNNYIEKLYVDIVGLSVVIEDEFKRYEVIEDTKLKSKYKGTLRKLKKGETVYGNESDKGEWILARTEDNLVGYIKLNKVRTVSKITYKKYPAINKKRDIKLSWDLYFKTGEKFKPFFLPESIDIIAPTWFELSDNEDMFNDISNDDYYNYVQSSGKEIWAVFTNGFNPKLTNEFLNNGIKRSQLADKIIQISKDKNYNAINIDFENIYLKDKDVFSAFIKELYCKLKSENIILSVDVAVLSNSENWSLFFDRNVIAKYSDYIMLMAYDENVSGRAGSVSSLPWAEYGIKGLLDYAPAEKVVLGLPFYTRLWEQFDEGGILKTKSSALKIKSVEETLSKLNIILKIDEVTGQNYGETTIDDVTYKIWNEDSTSLKKRLELAKKYNLSGVAVWALSYGTEEMWNLID